MKHPRYLHSRTNFKKLRNNTWKPPAEFTFDSPTITEQSFTQVANVVKTLAVLSKLDELLMCPHLSSASKRAVLTAYTKARDSQARVVVGIEGLESEWFNIKTHVLFAVYPSRSIAYLGPPGSHALTEQMSAT
jgi:hypothetical protein